MARLRTGLTANLGSLYRSYGGIGSLFASSYFWIAIALTALSWRAVDGTSWANLAQAALPNLAGFSIAAFAILFAILDDRSRTALRAPDPRLDDRSPLLILASSVCHAVIVQIGAFLYSVVYMNKPFPIIEGFECVARTANLVGSAIGVFLVIYAVILVMAAVLSIFKMLELAA